MMIRCLVGYSWGDLAELTRKVYGGSIKNVAPFARSMSMQCLM